MAGGGHSASPALLPPTSSRPRNFRSFLAQLSLWAAVLLVPAAAAHAAELHGRVVGVSDGDTITVIDAGHALHKVRLQDIDAPESKQAFGSRSKQALSELCFRKNARLETAGKDRYGRVIATVHCAGKNANAEQVRQGMAWVFDRYARPDSPLYLLQQQAKAARRGLWSDLNPTPPWEWRRHEWDRKGVVRSSAVTP